ncbi:MAG TPA: HAMP domain-containing sensor histidine kinase, partial [Vicinamibacterales bacterium]|nr:HAMP domain-containing sensor histidine kinase [Vicinamibacterales bacterium]
MSDFTAAGFGDLIAERIGAEHVALSARWLERLRGLLTVDVNDVFPTDHLLDHIPALIREVAEYVRIPESEAIAANTAITAKAQELGELRHTQQASVHQLLAEYRLLGNILTHFVRDELERLGVFPSAAEAVEIVRRVNDAIWILMQTTVNTFVSEYSNTIARHSHNLESFNRMVSHELRQPLGTVTYAVPLLRAEAASGNLDRHEHFLKLLDRNVARLTQLMEQLEAISRVQTTPADSLDVQRTEIETVVWEVARQLREMADAKGVAIEVADGLPTVMIDAARLELIVMNLVSNAVKYADPNKDRRVVRIALAPAQQAGTVCIAVHDNGIGIPSDSLSTIFSR